MSFRYSPQQQAECVQTFTRDGFCVLPGHFSEKKLQAWHASFAPLLSDHMEREGHRKNRGNGRFYVTLPFAGLWADPEIFENPDVLRIVEQLVGADLVMCQLATDTPVLGSEYQEVHRDTPPLFPELADETPSFQLAVNFPLVDVDLENGPIEIARGTHMMSKADAMAKLHSGEVTLDPIPMKLGDVMIRDVRGLHRGTPNKTHVPRPMVVIGYSRRWLFRPEVSVTIPQATWNGLSDRAKGWLRFNSVVSTLAEAPKEERYQSFAY